MVMIQVTVDGERREDDVEPRLLLVHYLRERVGKVGTPVGCDTCNCGACTVQLDGQSVKSCSVLAVQADGADDRRPSRASPTASGTRCRRRSRSATALQCGYCTPGMIMASVDLLKENPNPTEEEIRDGLEGNLCRCTGYQNIVKAVQHAAAARRCPMTATEAEPATPGRTSVGQPMRRKEDARLVTGRTNWTDNIVLPGMLHMAIAAQPDGARPDHPDRRLGRADPARCGRRLLRRRPRRQAWVGCRCVWPVTDGHHDAADLPALAIDEVRYVGDAVAVVVAADRYAAADALEAIEVDYEPLPAGARHAGGARRRGRPLVHADLGTNTCLHLEARQRRLRGREGARRTGVVTRRYVNQRLIPMAMEPRAVVAAPTGADGELTLWSSTQIPHIVRVLLALTAGIPEQQAPGDRPRRRRRLRLQAAVLPRGDPRVRSWPSELGRPVKWTESRSENAQATHHGRDQIQDIELAVTNDGQDPRPAGRPARQHGRLPAADHRRASRCSARSCTTPSTRWRPTTSPAPASSPPRRRPTPTAAPAGRRRPTPSSGSMDDLAAELGIDPLELRRAELDRRTTSSRTRRSRA